MIIYEVSKEGACPGRIISKEESQMICIKISCWQLSATRSIDKKVDLFALHIPKLEEKITVIEKTYQSISNKGLNLTIS